MHDLHHKYDRIRYFMKKALIGPLLAAFRPLKTTQIPKNSLLYGLFWPEMSPTQPGPECLKFRQNRLSAAPGRSRTCSGAPSPRAFASPPLAWGNWSWG